MLGATRALIAVSAAITAAADSLYTPVGSIDVGTYENSIFFWPEAGTDGLWLLENIPCSYIDHYGKWDKAFAGHSYARIRSLQTGVVVANISETIGYGFISPFIDYERGTAWLFGNQDDRCKDQKEAPVFSWSSKDLRTWTRSPCPVHQAAPRSPGPVFATAVNTFNVEVSAVPNPPEGLPPHKYIMILEPFSFAVNNDPTGDLTKGWSLLDSTPPKDPSGGPSIRFNPADQYYYIITGGHTVDLVRTKDFRSWQNSPKNPIIEPTPADCQTCAVRKQFLPGMRDHCSAWDWNSNDGDVCCLHPNVSKSYL
eukprot:gene4304-782_t